MRLAVSDGLARLEAALLAPRQTATLVLAAALLAAAYVLWTFDLDFLAGQGSFWAYPVGPWLLGPEDLRDNSDVLDYLIGYTGFVRSGWSLPLFYVPQIGAPNGTSVVFLDVIPIVAFAGRAISAVLGTLVLPYGAWVGLCFLLSGITAALVLAAAGQRSLLAAIGACLFAISAPPLLHRFAHLPLMADFLIIGALYGYVRDGGPIGQRGRFVFWLGWMLLATLVNPYMMTMTGAVFAASVARSWRREGVRARLGEPLVVGAAVLLTLAATGYFGGGTSPTGGGYGFFSMNLLSPVLPQRSGLFPSQQALIDATGGQYEGFSYLGIGGVVLLAWALALDPADLWRTIWRHRELAAVLALLTAFAVSHRVFAGPFLLLDLALHWRLDWVFGIFRSSGRMFWPVYYVLLFGSLVFMLRHASRPLPALAITALCALQLLDTEPLRARLTRLTEHGGQPVLDASAWSERLHPARFLQIYPGFFCSDVQQQTVDLELQLVAIRAGTPFNTVYNPRIQPRCGPDRAAALAGPWAADTLYVYLDGSNALPAEWSPPGLQCTRFDQGRWCLGRNEGVPASK